MEAAPSAKYVPTNSFITSAELAIQFASAIKNVSIKQAQAYGRLIHFFLKKYHFIDMPLQHSAVHPAIEAYINEILIKEKANRTFQEEISWMQTIEENILSEDIVRHENTYLLVYNLNKLLQYQDLNDIPFPSKVKDSMNKLAVFNRIFDASYQANLDANNSIININALNETIKNFL